MSEALLLLISATAYMNQYAQQTIAVHDEHYQALNSC